jgi:DNA modification methylase
VSTYGNYYLLNVILSIGKESVNFMDNSVVNNNETEPQIIYDQGDVLETIQKYPKESFDLLITSPPYNMGKEYEQGKPFQEYLTNQERIIDELVKYVSPKGSICWQVGNTIDTKTREVIPLDVYFYELFKKKGLFLRNRIIWYFGHGLHASNRFSGRYETILWFTKSQDYIFNLDDVRVPSKYPGKRHFKGPKKGELSGNPKGKNPSDVWEIVLKDWENEIWNIPNVKANHREKTEHPCQYPIELVERCILALTNEASWILDPFAGVGSTLLAALKTNRNALGIELYQKYIDIGNERLEQFRKGSLKYRPITKPIYDHTKSYLSKMPEEFKEE